MTMIALVDEHYGRLRLEHIAPNDAAARIVDLGAAAMDDGAVAVFQVAHRVGEGRKRDCVRADIHRIIAEADRKR